MSTFGKTTHKTDEEVHEHVHDKSGKTSKTAKTAEEMHEELRQTIEASQAGAVLENAKAIAQKFPGLQEALQYPPPPEPPPEDSGARRSKK